MTFEPFRPTLMAVVEKKKSTTKRNFVPMVALLLITVLCITDAIRPSLAPGVKKTPRRPLRSLWYRRLEEGAEDVTKSRKIPILQGVRDGKKRKQDESISKEALANELSTLLDGIQTLALELDSTRSIPVIENVPVSLVSKPESTEKKSSRTSIKTANELREAVLDEGKQLKEVELDKDAQLLVNATTNEMLNHDVVQLMAKRFRSGSTPGNREPGDDARLALAIEGGGRFTMSLAGSSHITVCLTLTMMYQECVERLLLAWPLLLLV